MQHGLLVGKTDAHRGGETVLLDLCFRLFQRPGNMVDTGPHRFSRTAAREQAIALSEKIFERSAAAFGELARGAKPSITRLEKDLRLGAATPAVKRELAL